MTTTSLRATIRRRLNQTDNTNTQFADAMIDELGDEGRLVFAGMLPEKILTALQKTSDLSPTTGLASYPTDYLRSLEDPYVLVDSVYASLIPLGQKWRLKFQESNDLVKSGAANKYYWETDDGIHCLPTTATTITYKYLRIPDPLDAVANLDMPLDVDPLVVDYVFEKMMGTRRGDKELALMLARQRGVGVREIKVEVQS